MSVVFKITRMNLHKSIHFVTYLDLLDRWLGYNCGQGNQIVLVAVGFPGFSVGTPLFWTNQATDQTLVVGLCCATEWSL